MMSIYDIQCNCLHSPLFESGQNKDDNIMFMICRLQNNWFHSYKKSKHENNATKIRMRGCMSEFWVADRFLQHDLFLHSSNVPNRRIGPIAFHLVCKLCFLFAEQTITGRKALPWYLWNGCHRKRSWTACLRPKQMSGKLVTTDQ